MYDELRAALDVLINAAGPIPMTKRNDNLTQQQIRLRDSVVLLRDWIDEEDFWSKNLPREETPRVPRASVRGDGQDRYKIWKKEAGH